MVQKFHELIFLQIVISRIPPRKLLNPRSDVCVAHGYQAICKSLSESHPSGAEAVGAGVSAPMYLFDGSTFHTLMTKHRQGHVKLAMPTPLPMPARAAGGAVDDEGAPERVIADARRLWTMRRRRVGVHSVLRGAWMTSLSPDEAQHGHMGI